MTFHQFGSRGSRRTPVSASARAAITRALLAALLAATPLGACMCSDGVNGSEGEGEGGEGEGDGGEGEGEGEGGEGEGEGEPELTGGPVCTGRGWCWESPLPAGGQASGIWAVGPSDVWLASTTDLFHITSDDEDDIEHVPFPTPTPYLNAAPVWGLASNDVWAHGFNGFVHWDGTHWSIAQSGTFAASIHGVARDDAWAVGFAGAYHYDGSVWALVHQEAAGGFNDVWAFDAQTAIATGGDATKGIAKILTRTADGVTVTDLLLPESQFQGAAAYATSADDVWIGVANGTLQHFANGAWTAVPLGTVGAVYDLWGDGSGDVWALDATGHVAHITPDGDGFAVALNTIDPSANPSIQFTVRLSGTAGDDLWVSDMNGGVRHWDGAEWRALKVPLTRLEFVDLAETDGTAFAVSATELAQRNADRSWSLAEPPTNAQLTGVARAGADTFLFTTGPAYRWDDTDSDWQLLISESPVVDACATTDGTVWGIGETIQRFEGGEWIDDPNAPAPLRPLQRLICEGDEVWASSVTTYQASENAGAVMRFSNGAWRHLGVRPLRALGITDSIAFAEDDLYVLADGIVEVDIFTDAERSLVMHWNGAEWLEPVVPTSSSGQRVRGVGGTSASDLWVVGTSGLVAHDTGSGFTQIAFVDEVTELRWVQPGGDGSARVFSATGAAWRYDPAGGGSWTQELTPVVNAASVSSDFLVDVAFTGPDLDDVFAAGDRDEALLATALGEWDRAGSFSAVTVSASADVGVFFVDYIERVGRWNGVDAVEEVGGSLSGVDRVLILGDDVLGVPESSSQGAVFRFDGASFVLDPSLQLPVEYGVIFGASVATLWAIGETTEPGEDDVVVARRVDGAWETFPEMIEPVAFGTSSAGDRLALDAGRAVWRLEDDGWRNVFAAPDYGYRYPATGGHILDLDDIWATALGGVLHFDGAWDTLAEPLGLGFSRLVAMPDGGTYALGAPGAIARRAP